MDLTPIEIGPEEALGVAPASEVTDNAREAEITWANETVYFGYGVPRCIEVDWTTRHRGD